MATEKEIACHKATLLDAINKQDWEHADTEMAWLSQNHPELQPDDFYPDLLSALDQVMGDDCEIPIALAIRGFIKSNLDDYTGAITDFDKAIELDSYNTNLYAYRGIANGLMGKHQEALADFDIVISRDRRYADIYSNRGITKDYLGDYQGALDDYEKAINLQPDSLLYYHLKGLVLLKIGEEKKAEEAFEKFSENRDKFDKKYNESKKRMKITKDQLIKRLDNIPDKLSLLKDKKDGIMDKSPHEIILYLYALLDHAMRNTLCYIAVVNHKCNFILTEKYLIFYKYSIQNFRDVIKKASIDINKYPDIKSRLNQGLTYAIHVRNHIAHIAHGKNIGKSLDENSKSIDKWESISGLTKTECYDACICFIDFFVRYLEFFDEYIKHQRWEEFNPFDVNSEDFIGKGDRNENQTKAILRNMGITLPEDRYKCCSKNKKSR